MGIDVSELINANQISESFSDILILTQGIELNRVRSKDGINISLTKILFNCCILIQS